MDKRLRARAEWAGGGSYIASRRYSAIVDRVAAKYNAQFDEVPNAPEPTESELTALRERYLEYRALEEESQLRWRALSENSLFVEIATICVKAAYRITLFAAALAILWNAFRTYMAQPRSDGPSTSARTSDRNRSKERRDGISFLPRPRLSRMWTTHRSVICPSVSSASGWPSMSMDSIAMRICRRAQACRPPRLFGFSEGGDVGTSAIVAGCLSALVVMVFAHVSSLTSDATKQRMVTRLCSQI